MYTAVPLTLKCLASDNRIVIPRWSSTSVHKHRDMYTHCWHFPMEDQREVLLQHEVSIWVEIMSVKLYCVIKLVTLCHLGHLDMTSFIVHNVHVTITVYVIIHLVNLSNVDVFIFACDAHIDLHLFHLTYAYHCYHWLDIHSWRCLLHNHTMYFSSSTWIHVYTQFYLLINLCFATSFSDERYQLHWHIHKFSEVCGQFNAFSLAQIMILCCSCFYVFVANGFKH